MGVLVRVAVRTMGTICQRVECTVVFLSPAVDVLSGSLVADSGLCDTVGERILNYHLLKPYVLCYLIHYSILFFYLSHIIVTPTIAGEVDLIFVPYASEDIRKAADDAGVELVFQKVAAEALGLIPCGGN